MSEKSKKMKFVSVEDNRANQNRRHHNNEGRAGTKNGAYYNRLKKFAKINGIPFGDEKK
jgi:hypothetical protein